MVEVSYPHSTLYMLTGPPSERGSWDWDETKAGQPNYYGGGSELHVSVSYTENGITSHGTDDWFRVSGKAQKLFIKTSDSKIRDAVHVQQILRPIGPGEANVAVSLAGRSILIPVLGVPLDIAPAESSDSVIKRYGTPDDELFVIAVWPKSKRVHNLFYYDNLRGNGGDSATHWKFNRYPGAVVVVDGGKVSVLV